MKEELIKLCHDVFNNFWVQEYAGSRPICKFCGSLYNKQKTIQIHEDYCPVLKYQEIIEDEKNT